jgi:predicted ATPase/DNA-binding winged helix-turn-helix (wHTH) protein
MQGSEETLTCDEAWSQSDDSVIAFGPFQLDRARYDLRKDGVPVRLGARAMAILLELTRSAGEILSSRELLRRIWQDTVVEEGTVRVHVALLRKCLRRAAPGDYVQNVTGRGYRFIAPLRSRNAPPAAEVVDPADAAPAMHAHNLPARITSIIGREQTIQSLVERMRSHRFVTIVGAGGSGKTTVAMAVAKRLAADYTHGVWLIDLAACMESRLVTNAIASALGVAPMAAHPLPHLLEWLSTRSMLLVLDNCEHVIEAAAELAETLLRAGPGVHVLTTSREPLRAAGEAVHELASLAVPAESRSHTRAELLQCPAIQLFVERAEACAGVGFNDEELQLVAEICRRLEGNPLAIEITAANVRLVGASSLVTSKGCEWLLSMDGRRTADQRQRSLRDTFNWSYSLLTSAEQAIFRRLAVFTGWFDVDCAVAVVAEGVLNDVDAFESLLALARKSLVQVDTRGEATAYRLLDLPRAYAREKLVEAGEADALKYRHARMWCSVGAAQIHAHVRRGADWVGVFGPRVEDLRAATRWSFRASSASSLRIKLTLTSLWFEFVLAAESPAEPPWPDLYAYVLRGCEGPLLPGLSKLLDHSRNSDQQVDHGRSRPTSALSSLWFERVIMRDYRIAINLAEVLRDRGICGPHESPLMDCMLALAWGYTGDHALACRHGQWALATLSSRVNEGPADILLRCHLRTVVARSLWLLGLPDQAAQVAKQGVEEALHSGNPRMLCTTLLVAISIAIWCGDSALATEYLDRLQSQAEAHSLEYYELWADCLRMILSNPAGSQSLESFQMSADPLNTSQYLDILASLGEELVSGDAMVRAEAGRTGWCTSEILRVKAERLIQAGDHDALSGAEVLLHRALEVARRQDSRSWELRAAMSLARLWKDQKRVREAHQLLATVYSGFTEGHGTADLKTARLLLGQLAEEPS